MARERFVRLLSDHLGESVRLPDLDLNINYERELYDCMHYRESVAQKISDLLFARPPGLIFPLSMPPKS